MHVEFLGIPRERAGVSEVEIEAETLGQLLGVLATRFPQLRELVTDSGLHSSVAANLNGDAFVSDPGTALNAHDRLILLSSDAGG
jgi:molybdopterin converting factor small subunit